MSGSTNFQQWNPSANNQENDAAYLADTARANGAQSGIANSQTYNKLYYQLSTFTTAMATIVANAGFTVNDSSLSGLITTFTNAFVLVPTVQAGNLTYAADTGAADVYVANFSPAITALTTGMMIRVQIANANLTPTPTLNVNSTGAILITKGNGIPLDIGDMPNGYFAIFVKSSTQWVLQNPALVNRVVNNYLPNTQWQIGTGLVTISQFLPDGTGAMPAISVSSYTTGSNTVVCTTTNTGQLKIGDLVVFSSTADANMKISSARVTALVVNASFTVKLPLGLSPSASAACTAQPTACGGGSGVGGNGFDGWYKTVSLNVWRETNVVNVIGSVNGGTPYSCGAQKQAAGTEVYYCTLSGKQIHSLINKIVTFGVYVMQKIRGGAGTWNLSLSSDGTGGATVTSVNGSAAIGTPQWIEVSYTVPKDATSINFNINLTGANGDIYYISQPMGGPGQIIGAGGYAKPAYEFIRPLVKYSPLSFIGASVAFPTVADAAGTYSFQYDIYAETNGAIAPNINGAYTLIEGYNTNALITGSNPRVFATRDIISPPITYGPIMGQQGANVKNFCNGFIKLSSTGYATIYTATEPDSWINVSFDMVGFEL